jgi:hypothetical protein
MFNELPTTGEPTCRRDDDGTRRRGTAIEFDRDHVAQGVN